MKQVTVADHSVADVAERLGTTTHSLYAWIKRYGPDADQHNQAAAEVAEIRPICLARSCMSVSCMWVSYYLALRTHQSRIIVVPVFHNTLALACVLMRAICYFRRDKETAGSMFCSTSGGILVDMLFQLAWHNSTILRIRCPW